MKIGKLPWNSLVNVFKIFEKTKKMPTKQVLILDSTQIVAWEECPQAWAFHHIEHLTSVRGIERPLLMGTYGHKMLENFYKALPGRQRIDAWNYVKTLDYSVNGKPYPLSDEDIQLIRDRLQLYVYAYSREDIVPFTDKDTIEVGFSYKVYEDDHYLFVLEGKMDRIDLIGSFSGIKSIMDHKFQLSMYNLYKRSIQFRNYALVGNANLFIINYIRLTKEVNENTFKRDIASFSFQEHRWWKEELTKKFHKIAKSIKQAQYEGSFIDQRRHSMCSGKFRKTCQFTPICEEMGNVDIENAKKRTAFYEIEEWSPW